MRETPIACRTMDRDEFENLRNLPDKKIVDDIKFVEKPFRKPAMYCSDVRIHHTGEAGLKLDMTYNPAADSININVTSMGEGPICRLDVRSNKHGDAGRTHKHELTTNKDIANNLPNAQAMPNTIEAMTPQQAFLEFCRLANIVFEGDFIDP